MQILSLLRQQRAQLVDVHELVSELRLLRRSRRSSLQDESLQGVHDLVSELQLLDSRLEVTGCQGERRQQRRVSFGDAAEQFGPSGSATQERHLQDPRKRKRTAQLLTRCPAHSWTASRGGLMIPVRTLQKARRHPGPFVRKIMASSVRHP
ncbi:unnamed protein product [Prorocentrum cordatum]|uniref:Uncharacterized protein n=1 Tax=Prorocentrum cordatum TaxID=2364126 RepID=A0ABN9W8Z7_9DINO|nr:unnamed protein product [Polarella glacialis]